jgi:hypothetical protein
MMEQIQVVPRKHVAPAEQIQVIPRNTIAPIRRVEQGGELHELGELRDFRWNDQLRNFMPARFSVSWVRLEEGEVLEPRVSPIPSMMVFYEGSGEILGDLCRPVAKEDVVVMPSGCKHGFVGGPGGLCALSIQFGEGLYAKPERSRPLLTHSEQTLSGLKDYNQERLEAFMRRPIFGLLRDGTLHNDRKRQAYLDALQTWVEGNQALIYSRQASCYDPICQDVFLRHMREEIGHDVLHAARAGTKPSPWQSKRDPIMEALTNWFTYQMFVLDNVEKAAIVHLVLENASSVYHQHSMPVLGKYMKNEYFEVHVESDAEHARMGEDLLRNESPRTYARLRHIVGEAWDMIGAMADRLVDITRTA